MTRSIAPFLSTRHVAAEARHLQVAGADDRLDGGGEEERIGRHSGDRAVGRLDALHHADFHAAFGRALQLHVVHEVADEEDAAAARLQEVLRRERVGDCLRDRSRRPVADADASAPGTSPFVRSRTRRTRACAVSLLVAVLDRVDHRFADRDAHPVHRVLVEADAARDVVADHLDEIQHLERAGELEPNDLVTVRRHEPSRT